jgi:acyl-coenzyme A synthetase/AMP-(fatty) acid ligase
MTFTHTPDLYEHVPDADWENGFFALEGELLELACVRECAVVHTDLPELGPAVVVAFVPLAPQQEIAGRRAVLAACQRNLPALYAHAVAVDDVPRTVEGAVREGELLDRVLPQIARDLMSPAAMAD